MTLKKSSEVPLALRVLPGIPLAILLLSSSAVSASIWNLTDNNSSTSINVGSQAGMYNWVLQMPDGSFQNQLAQQWFWFRVGNTPQLSLDTIGSPIVSQSSGRTLSATYFDAAQNFSVRIDYTLSGGTVASGVSDIGETITINNTSSTQPLNFHFYQYSEFQLEGSSAGESVQLGKNLRGLFNQADVTKGGAALTETVTTPGANYGEASAYPITLGELNGPTAVNLNDVASAANGNTWALQWDFSIAAGGSQIISKDKYLTVTPVPEPTIPALVSVGLVLAALRRSKRSS